MDEQLIKKRLAEPFAVVTYSVTDSTNLRVKEYGRAGGALPVIIAADAQTAGRGRLGRAFYSPADTGVYFTVGFPAELAAKGLMSVTGAAAVALRRAIRGITGLEPGIKWVNDLYLNGGKIAGILAETASTGKGLLVLVGIGVNLTTKAFPAGFSSPAASLGVGGIAEELVAATASELLALLRAGTASFIEEYRRASIVPGRDIVFSSPGSEPRSARALGIDDECGLIVRLDSGEETVLRTGEISVRFDRG